MTPTPETGTGITENLPGGAVLCHCPLGCPWTHTGRAPNHAEIIAVLISQRAADWILGRFVAKMMRALAVHVAEHLSYDEMAAVMAGEE